MSEKCVRPLKNPPSNFVKRARLIRRRTTNLYDRARGITLKSSDEQSLIEQVLIIKLKKYEEATEQDLSAMNGFHANYIPYIFYARPPLAAKSPLPAPLFYPDFSQPWKQDASGSKDGAYLVVLTDERGNRTYAYCYKYRNDEEEFRHRFFEQRRKFKLEVDDFFVENSVVVLTSNFPAEALLSSLASDVVRRFYHEPEKLDLICNDLLKLKFTASPSTFKLSRYVVPGYVGINFSGKPIIVTMSQIGLENTIFIFLSLLSERRIIVTGENVKVISDAVQMFARMLAPMDWPHTLIPVIPDTHTDLVHNPTPYLCGLCRHNLHVLKNTLCRGLCPSAEDEDVTIIDCSRGILAPAGLQFDKMAGKPQILEALLSAGIEMGFSKSMILDLRTSLKSVFPYNDEKDKIEKANTKIEDKIMIWYAELFGHYKNYICGANLLSSKNKKRFISAHPVPETRACLQWFIESGIFQAFIYTVRDSKYYNPLYNRFARILEKHAPPVKSKGTRNRARTLFYRILHG